MNLLKNSKIFRFLFIGIVNTLFSYFIFIILYYFLFNKEMALTLSFIISILFNFQTISKYVFNDSKQKKFIVFILIYVFTYLLNLLHLFVTVDIYDMNVYLAQFLTLLYLPVISFYLNKNYVYNLK